MHRIRDDHRFTGSFGSVKFATAVEAVRLTFPTRLKLNGGDASYSTNRVFPPGGSLHDFRITVSYIIFNFRFHDGAMTKYLAIIIHVP